MKSRALEELNYIAHSIQDHEARMRLLAWISRYVKTISSRSTISTDVRSEFDAVKHYREKCFYEMSKAIIENSHLEEKIPASKNKPYDEYRYSVHIIGEK